MQDREMFLSKAAYNGLQAYPGRFFPNGSSSPTTVAGCVKSVTRTGTGAWTVTLQDWLKGSAFAIVGIIKGVARYSALTATEWQVLGVDLTVPSITMAAYTTSSGAAVDIAANASNMIDFVLLLKQKGLKDGSAY